MILAGLQVDFTTIHEGVLYIPNSDGAEISYSGGFLTNGMLASQATPVIAFGPQFMLTHHVVSTTTCATCTGFNLNYAQIACGSTLDQTYIAP